MNLTARSQEVSPLADQKNIRILAKEQYSHHHRRILMAKEKYSHDRRGILLAPEARSLFLDKVRVENHPSSKVTISLEDLFVNFR